MGGVVGTTTCGSGAVGCGPGANPGGVAPVCPGGMGAEGAGSDGGTEKDGSGPSPPHDAATGVAAMRRPTRTQTLRVNSHCGGASSGVRIGTGTTDVGTTDVRTTVVGVVVVGDGASCAGARGASTNGDGASGRGPGPSIGPPPTGAECCGPPPGFTDGGSGGSGAWALHDTAQGVAATRTPTTTCIPFTANLCAIVSVIWTPRKRTNCMLIVPRPSPGFRE